VFERTCSCSDGSCKKRSKDTGRRRPIRREMHAVRAAPEGSPPPSRHRCAAVRGRWLATGSRCAIRTGAVAGDENVTAVRTGPWTDGLETHVLEVDAHQWHGKGECSERISLCSAPPNGSRLSCSAQVRPSQMQFYLEEQAPPASRTCYAVRWRISEYFQSARF